MMVTRRTRIKRAVMILAFPMVVFVQGHTTPRQEGAQTKHPIVLLETTLGTVKIEVFTDKAPITAKNFLDYASSGFYTDTIFHRAVPNFVIQGGGYLESMEQKTTKAAIENESKNGLKNLRGTLSMARYDDPHSATSQFFINLDDNAHLDPPAGGWGYAVFAKVVEGMDVVDKIGAARTRTRSVKGTPFQNVPLQAIVIKSSKVLP